MIKRMVSLQWLRNSAWDDRRSIAIGSHRRFEVEQTEFAQAERVVVMCWRRSPPHADKLNVLPR